MAIPLAELVLGSAMILLSGTNPPMKSADETPAPKPPAQVNNYWETDAGFGTLAAMHTFGAGGPCQALGVRVFYGEAIRQVAVAQTVSLRSS